MSESTCGFKSRQPHHLASLEKMPLYARVVELADSLDSGSSVHYGRAGSSPASRTMFHRRAPFRWNTPRGFQGSTTSYRYARVVELADSLDSGSSVHYGRAGSSPASRTMFHRRAPFRWNTPRGFQGSTTSYRYARVVELADSLDSGSSVHYGRAGSSPASRTIKITTPAGVVIFMVTGGI